MNIASNETRVNLIQNGTIDENDSYRKYKFTKFHPSLKKHQELALHNMKCLEDGNITINSNSSINTNIGVYSDCVGAGKSYTLMALIDINKTPLNSERREIHMYGAACITYVDDERPTLTTMIVVPHSIVKQWESYIIENTDFSFYKINNNKSREAFSPDRTLDILLVSSTMYGLFMSNHNDIRFNRVIFDEADSINIPNCEKPNANFTWMVTSSLQNLFFVHGYYYIRDTNYISGYERAFRRHYTNGIRKNGYIKETFKSLTPLSDPILKYIVVKNNDDFVQNCFQLLDPDVFTVQCSTPAYLNIIRGATSTEVLNRLSAGDKEGAMLALGCNVDTLSNIVGHVTKDLQMQLGNLESQLDFIQGLSYSRGSDLDIQRRRIESTEKEICEVKEKIKGIEERMQDYSDSACPICMDTFDDPVACVSCCKNMFCLQCLTQSLEVRNSCPMCRSEVNPDSMNIIYDKKVTTRKDNRPTKEEALLSLLRRKDRKFLVFSSYDNTFKNLEKTLTTSNTRYAKVSGNSFVIQSNLNKYKNGDLDVLLLNSNNYGSGINLQNTTDVIFFHKMSKDLESQVIGRAQRYGRTDRLRVHFLYYDHELS